MSGDTKKYKQKWIELFKRGELVCALCLKKIEKIGDITYDHWVPRSLGGPTNEENGRPAHSRCNSLKGCIPPDIFEQHREEILSGTYKLSQPYSLSSKQNIRYKAPVITYQGDKQVQKTHKRKHKKKLNNKQIKKEAKQKKKQKRIEQKRIQRRERKKFIKNQYKYKASYKIIVPTILKTNQITLGQTVGCLRKVILGQKIKYDVAKYVIIGFIDKKPVARELFENKDKKISTRLVEVDKPLDYKQAKLFANKLNSYLSQRVR